MAFRALIIALLGITAVIRLAGAGPAAPEKEKMNLNGLVTNSPFGSAKSGAVLGSGGNEPFEFRAVLEGNLFSIYDTNTHRSIWVELNDPVNGFSVKGYDVGKESITVDYQGKAMTLAIKRAPAAAQVFQPPPQIGPQPGPGLVTQPPGTQPGQVGPTGPSAVDQQRIQQIQEEIRRRRALRSQATPNGSTPGASPNYNGGPQMQPSTSSGPVPVPSNSSGPQPYPQRN